jgi:hypothetical protein
LGFPASNRDINDGFRDTEDLYTNDWAPYSDDADLNELKYCAESDCSFFSAAWALWRRMERRMSEIFTIIQSATGMVYYSLPIHFPLTDLIDCRLYALIKYPKIVHMGQYHEPRRTECHKNESAAFHRDFSDRKLEKPTYAPVAGVSFDCG